MEPYEVQVMVRNERTRKVKEKLVTVRAESEDDAKSRVRSKYMDRGNLYDIGFARKKDAMRNISASDRKNLIRLASDLPKGSQERKAILAGLKSAARGNMHHYVGIVDSDDRVVWHTGEVWAAAQNRWPKDMAREAVTDSDLRARGWDKYTEDEAFDIVDEIRADYEREKKQVEKWLNFAADQGEIGRKDNRIHGGKWYKLSSAKTASAYMRFLQDVGKIEAAMHSARANLSRFPKDQQDFVLAMKKHLDLVAKALKEIDRSI